MRLMTPILNREFKHPEDGWYMIEPLGEHPNQAAGVMQVVDQAAVRTMADAFNSQAKDGFPGLLVDPDHLSHQADRESRAYGWLERLQAREDGLYGQIRWTGTGRRAVDEGDYRFFSTEYDGKDLVSLNTEGRGTRDEGGELKRVRPVRLAGLALTNRPNNRGGKPITNRQGEAGGAIAPQRHRGTEAKGASQDKNFAGALDASAVNQPKPNNRKSKPMTSIATKLGLAAEASEEAVLGEVTKLMNRAVEAEKKIVPLEARVKDMEAEQLRNREAQADADLEPVKDRLTEPERTALRAQLIANREVTLPLLRLATKTGTEKTGAAEAKGPVINRATAKTPADKAVADKSVLLNREVRSYQDSHKCTFERAFNAVREMKPELFQAES